MRTMTKTASCLVLAAAMTAPVHAELVDPPYFNLWLGTAGNQQVGQGDYLLLCGTSGGCNGDTNAVGGLGTGYAIFKTAAPNSGAGSGHIDPFMRFQHNEGAATGSATTEAAFNTSASPNTGTIFNSDLTEYSANQAKDIDAGKDFNHAIRLGDLIVDEDGYFTFRLDINEPGGTKSNILLDELQIFVAGSATLNRYVLDKASNQQDGEPVSGSREMDVLQYLHAHGERAVSREELLHKVWGYANALALETRTVDIHIAKLRRKIERDPAAPQILLTVRGAGYRLLRA